MTTLQGMTDEVLDTIQDTSVATAGVTAQGTITLGGLPLATESLVIDGVVFTFQADEREAAGEVEIGSDVATTCTNLAAAINEDVTSVTATATSTTVVVTAVEPGPDWSNLVFTESATNVTISAFGATRAGVYGDRVKRILNRNHQEICGSMHPLILLPNLETSATVTTGTENWVALPSDFQKHLFRAYSETYNRPVRIFGRRDQLMDRFTRVDQSGRVLGVAVWGSRLYYQRIPSEAETLRLEYYRRPDPMVYAGDTPEGLPPHLASRLLVAATCRDLYASTQEDGVDGAKVNTGYWDQRFVQAMAELVGWLGPEAKVPTEFNDTINLDSLFW